MIETIIVAIISIILGAVVSYMFAYWQFRRQSTYRRRMEVLEDAYEKIKLASRSFASLANPLQEGGRPAIQEKEKDFEQKANEMLQYLDIKRLFFSSYEQEIIDRITKKFFEAGLDYRYKNYVESDSQYIKERKDLYVKIWNLASEEIPQLIVALEKIFRDGLRLK